MLWLCLHFPRLPLSALGTNHENAAVVDQRGSQRWLITDASASPAGTPLSKALSLDAGLRVQVRKPSAEQAALQSLAYWAYRFGQPVAVEIQNLAEPGCIPRALLWVEIGSSLEFFGGIESLRDAIFSELLELGHVAQAAIAPTRAAAALLACAGRSDPVFSSQQLHEHIAELSITLLHWPGEVLSALSGVGFRRMRELFAVPRDAFTKRFGAHYRLVLDQMLGLASEPYEAIVPPETFRRRFELFAEIEDVEQLQFPLNRLCLELQAYLRTRDRGLRSVTLAVLHAGAREARLHAQFVDPHRDAKRIFDALHERLERDGLPLPARELVLMAEDFAEAVVPQSDLFDPRAGQAQAWAAAIERIHARLGTAVGFTRECLNGTPALGPNRVWMPQVVEDHRPECGTHRNGLAVAEASLAATPKGKSRASSLLQQQVPGHRPTFLLPEPSPIPPPGLPAGAAFERIESGWWDGRDVRRDYTTLDINGSRAWVFRDVESGTWHLHGWFS